MKHLFFLLLLSPVFSYAQITVVHDFTNHDGIQACSLEFGDTAVQFYYAMRNTHDYVDIFDSSFNVWKSVPLSHLPAGAVAHGCWNVSRKLFNTDGIVEILVQYSLGPNQFNLALLRANGTEIQEFPACGQPIIWKMNGTFFMVVNNYAAVGAVTSRIYELPGTTPLQPVDLR